MRRSLQLASSLTLHLGFAVILALLMGSPRLERQDRLHSTRLVWTAPKPGTGDGGGSGGNARRAAAAPLQRVIEQNAPRFVLPRMPDVLATVELPGVSVAFAAPHATGSGTDDGAPGGRGEGTEGPGSGTGRGPAAGGGDGPFVDGTPGLTSPRLILEKPPEYTEEAMRARAQGAVLLEAVVLEDGSVGAIKVLRAPEPSYGLDRKAIDAIRAWRFSPGSYQGRAVRVTVVIELVFTLR